MSVHKLSTFRVDGDLFGVDAELVQEVSRSQQLTPVPLAPAAVAGLMNLRGEVVTALDLRRLLGRPDRPAGTAPMNVVIRADGGAVSLLVDLIESVEDVPLDSLEPTPGSVTGVAREVIRGAYQLEDELLLSLDVYRAIDMENAQ